MGEGEGVCGAWVHTTYIHTHYTSTTYIHLHIHTFTDVQKNTHTVTQTFTYKQLSVQTHTEIYNLTVTHRDTHIWYVYIKHSSQFRSFGSTNKHIYFKQCYRNAGAGIG